MAIDYPLRGVPSPLTALSVLRDRDGGLWIGTAAHGLVHSYQGKATLFTQQDGLSSNLVLSLFEDREGTIWVGTSEGIDRFREWPVTTLSVKQGLSNSNATSVLAARDGSIWLGTADGLTNWKEGRTTIYRKRNHPGLPDDMIQSIFEDERGRIWVSGSRGLAALENGEFNAVPAVPAGFTHAIASDNRGGLWLSLWLNPNDYGLAHLVDGSIIEHAPWQKLGGGPGAGLVARSGRRRLDGTTERRPRVFSRGRVTQPVTDHRRCAHPEGSGRFTRPRRSDVGRDRQRPQPDHERARRHAHHCQRTGLQYGALDHRRPVDSYWLYRRAASCVSREPNWMPGPPTRSESVQSTTFDSADGIRLVPILQPSRPAVTRSQDGRIWFVNGTTLSFIDPSRIGLNTLPPPVHIEQIVADGQTLRCGAWLAAASERP